MINLSVKNVAVLNGDGTPAINANIHINHGKIAEISNSDYEALDCIDGTGLVACPGFIDMHSHSDLRLMKQPTADEKVRQGITTELLGQDGLGLAPLRKNDSKTMATLVAGLNGQIDDDKWTWDSFSDYLEVVDSQPLPNNMAVLASHGPIRLQVLGMASRQPDDSELLKIKQIVHEALQQGAFGLSTGLIYPPCSFAESRELTAINEVLAEHNAPFVVHQRDEGYLIRQAFAELLGISSQTGSHLHISHLQAYGEINWPLMDEVISSAEKYAQSGGKISWDRYPYTAGCTVLSAVLPSWTFSAGTEALVHNLKDDSFRQQIKDDFKKGLDVWNNRAISVGWKNIFVTAVESEANRWMEGKSCEELANSTHKDPIDFVCDLLSDEKLAVTMVSFYGSDEVMEKIIAHPLAAIGTDGIYGGKPHPRLYGSYPKYFNHFVNQKQLLSLPEAIRKVTNHPAEILGLSDRGLLKEGYWADVVLFTPETLRDYATYEKPEQYSDGIDYVIVNGEIAVSKGQYTGVTAGRALRKC